MTEQRNILHSTYKAKKSETDPAKSSLLRLIPYQRSGTEFAENASIKLTNKGSRGEDIIAQVPENVAELDIDCEEIPAGPNTDQQKPNLDEQINNLYATLDVLFKPPSEQNILIIKNLDSGAVVNDLDTLGEGTVELKNDNDNTNNIVAPPTSQSPDTFTQFDTFDHANNVQDVCGPDFQGFSTKTNKPSRICSSVGLEDSTDVKRFKHNDADKKYRDTTNGLFKEIQDHLQMSGKSTKPDILRAMLERLKSETCKDMKNEELTNENQRLKATINLYQKLNEDIQKSKEVQKLNQQEVCKAIMSSTQDILNQVGEFINQPYN